MNTETQTRIHEFERAGLGLAPFIVVGFSVEKFVSHPGAPAQPACTCDFCGTAIMNVFHVQSSDGRRIKIGCDCVQKTGDAGLIKVVNAKMAEFKRQAKVERDNARIEKAKQLLTPELRKTLAIKPHPYNRPNCTYADYIEWCLANAGTTGKLMAARMIERESTA